MGKYDLNKYCAVLAGDFPNACELNSMARLASPERPGSSISRFYDNCKKENPGKKGYPQFQKDCRWVEENNTADSFLGSDGNPHSTVNISPPEEAETRILPLAIANCPDY